RRKCRGFADSSSRRRRSSGSRWAPIPTSTVAVAARGPTRRRSSAHARLPLATWIPISAHHNIAIFTWKGATVEVDGVSEVEYVADETPMVSYVNVHAVLDGRRIRAIKAAASGSDINSTQGPRVMVVGPTDSGKNSLSSMLLNWACKRSWKPTFVDLDIGQGSISIPGCIAATPVKLPIDAAGRTPLELPLVYFYGHTTPSTNIELYKVLLKEMAETVELQFSKNIESRAAGMVINSMGWIEGVGYELLLHAIDTFKADVILVQGQEKLYSMLKGKRNVDVVKLHKSGGVVSRSAKVRELTRSLRIRDYFYGSVKGLSPHAYTVNFNDISVFRIGGGPQAPRSALPIGAEPVANPIRLVTVSINRELLHSVLAVSYAKEQDQILSSNVAGFVNVIDIDMQRKVLTYLSPCPGELPGKLLVSGTLTWSES
ncbi:uncharacterized protein A4U43_UnF9510, partial [Asparagus officinalis]